MVYNKNIIQELRQDDWDKLFTCVKSFCEKHDIKIPDLDDVHSTTRFCHSHLEVNQVTIEHYFIVEIFFTVIDKWLQKLNNRFNVKVIGLLTLSYALAPKGNYKAFNFDTMDFNEKGIISWKILSYGLQWERDT